MYKLARASFVYLCGAVELYNEGTNEYTGSAPAKDGKTGPFADAFRYKVFLKAEDKHPVKTVAQYYYGIYSFPCTDPATITEKEFDPDENGVKAAFDWLEEEYNK